MDPVSIIGETLNVPRKTSPSLRERGETSQPSYPSLFSFFPPSLSYMNRFLTTETYIFKIIDKRRIVFLRRPEKNLDSQKKVTFDDRSDLVYVRVIVYGRTCMCACSCMCVCLKPTV